MESKNSNWQMFTIIILSFFLLFSFFIMGWMSLGHAMMSYVGTNNSMDISEHRMAFLKEKDTIISRLLSAGKYTCCLTIPCTYCIEKSPKHGEGATCTCLDDIVNGRHPCGECIGEILEGHGNKYLKEYFAPAIAEEVGMQHLDIIQDIIDDKYGV